LAYSKIDHDYNLFSFRRNGTYLSGPYFRDFLKVKSGQRGDSWREKRAKGLQAGTPYSTDSERITKRKDGTATLVWENHFTPGVKTTYEYSGQNQTVNTVVHLTNSTVDAENKSLVKILKKVKEETSHFNGLTPLGELHKTIQSLKHPYETMRHKIADHLGTLKKRKGALEKLPPRKREKAWRDVIGSTWLETNFGLRPLIHDVTDIAEAIARFNVDRTHKVRLRSKSETSLRATGFEQSDESIGYLMTDRLWETETTSFCTYTVGMEFDTSMHDGALNRLRKTLGITLENFVPTLYELMPWSWLIDYFSNMGDMIEAATTDTSSVKWIVKSVGVKTFRLQMSHLNVARTRARVQQGADKFISLSGNHMGEIHLQRMTLNRTLPSTLGVPVLRLSYPGKAMQQANLAAILAQFSGKTYSPDWENRVRAPYETTRQRARGVRRASDFLN
jgi:hypothetical protein